MKKTLRTMLLAALMVMVCMTAAFADETPAPTDEPTPPDVVDIEAAKAAIGDTMVNIKYGATNMADVILAMENTVREQDTQTIISGIKRTNTPTSFKEDGGMSCMLTFTDGSKKTVVVSYNIISPTLQFKTSLNGLRATDDQNRSKSTLLNYVNSSLALEAVANADYENALGTAPAYAAPKFTWNATDYYAKGGLTYTFTQEYMGQTLTRTVTVDSVSTKAPNISIDYDDGTVNTTRDIKYSLDRRSWSNCSENMKIPDKWLDERVYFYRPASTYADESSTTYLDIPDRAETPTAKLELTATSHSITVTNVWDYDHPQFSVDGKQWKSSNKSNFVLEGLNANTKYTVYVREGGTRDQLASKSLTGTITTAKKLVTDVDVKAQREGKTQYITADATVKPNISSKTLSGSLASDDMRRLKAMVKEAHDDKYTIYTDLRIEQLMEENEGKEITATKFTMPMSSLSDVFKFSNTTISLDSPIASISLKDESVQALKGQGSGGTLTISMQKVGSVSSGSKFDFLKDCLNDGLPVFNITIKNNSNTASNIKYSLPYKLGAKERLDSLTVYHVDEKGKKTEMEAVYNAAKHALVFTTDKSGYFAIVQERNSSPVMPFTDMRDHWAYNYVAYCTSNGLFKGVDDYTFAPNMEISRSMIVTLLARLDGSDRASYPTTPVFADVKGYEWFAASVQWAYQNGIIDKQGDLFGPEATMSREDIACVLANYLKYKKLMPESCRSAGYEDMKSISTWAVEAVNALAETGVMTGTDGNKFTPNGTMTRAEMATILYRLSNLG